MEHTQSREQEKIEDVKKQKILMAIIRWILGHSCYPEAGELVLGLALRSVLKMGRHGGNMGMDQFLCSETSVGKRRRPRELTLSFAGAHGFLAINQGPRQTCSGIAASITKFMKTTGGLWPHKFQSAQQPPAASPTSTWTWTLLLPLGSASHAFGVPLSSAM